MPENKKLKGTISANGLSVRTILSSDGDDYISLTDLAKFKNKEAPADIIKNWMRVRNTVEYLGLWEQIHNQTFKLVEFERLKNEAGTNAFVLSPQKWLTSSPRLKPGGFLSENLGFQPVARFLVHRPKHSGVKAGASYTISRGLNSQIP